MSLVITGTALTKLLGPHALMLGQRLPQLRIVDNLDEAAQLVESARGSAQVHDESDQRQGTGIVTSQPTVALLVEEDCDGRDLALFTEAMTAGTGKVVVLGRWSPGPIWHADPAGHLYDPRRPDWSGPRWCILDEVAATDLLTVIAQPDPAPPDDASPTFPSHRPATPERRLPRQATRNARHIRPGTPGRRLELRVLGEPTLLVDGQPLTIRRTAAVEVLVLLAAHPDGADTRQLIDAIWPGPPRHSLTGRLYTTLSELRATIRTASGLNVIDHTDERYRLNPNHLDVDLWRLLDAVQNAATAVTHTTIAWKAVIDAYPDELAAGRAWPWLNPIRETVRRHVIDAHVALADAAPDIQRTLMLLQAAIRIDPYNSDLNTRAVNALAAAGEHAAANKLRDGYARRLNEAGLHMEDGRGPTATNMSGATASRR
ncbi:AfsR/SARP family transcriptional regulator [Micromonospora sp. URMC 103]|uniref:AfsR/SARP family transcriptional regulator n=1 Tax=Micromonospora sp. URMC 103 TaxID=3423406 RepID=UPI003F1A2CF0